MAIEFHVGASDELSEAALRYNSEVPGLGDAFIDEVERITEIIDAEPSIGRPINETFRSMLLARFPYSLIYTKEETAVFVIAVAHHRRRPGYWRGRSLR